MTTGSPSSSVLRHASLVLLASLSAACFEDPLPASSASSTSSTTAGDGDGDASGDGDGDPSGDGDGDASGDGDGDPSGDGDGDGDASGDGDGDPSGDGDGDPGDCSAGPYAVDYMSPLMLEGGMNSQGMVVGDVNNDGNLDIVSSAIDSHELRVFFGDGTGQLSAPQVTVLGSMVSPATLRGGAIADGVFDVVMRGFLQVVGTTRARVRGDGNGGWNDYEAGGLPGVDFQLGLADADDVLDLIYPDEQTLVVARGSVGQESFPSQPDDLVTSPAPWTSALGLLTVGHIDDDLELDVVVTGFGTAYIGAGDGQGGFEFGQQELGYFGGPSGITLGDTDGDGDLDVIITTMGGGSDAGHLFIGFGNGGFENGVELSAPSGPRGVIAGDIDKDGRDDLAMIGSGNMVTYLSAGESFGPAQQQPCGDGQRQVALGDFNSDCVEDVVSVSSSTDRVCVMLSSTP